MKKRKKKKSPGKNSQRFSWEDSYLRRNMWQPVTQLPTCPYCGKKMVIPQEQAQIANNLKKHFFLFNGKLMESVHRNYACSDYPNCDTTGRFEYKGTDKSVIRIISLPANETLRRMRAEVHYYINICVEQKLFGNGTELKNYLSEKMPVATGGIGAMHVGYMGEHMCKMTFGIIVEMLYNKKNDIEKFMRFNDSVLEDKKTKEMLDELTFTVHNSYSCYNENNMEPPKIDKDKQFYAIHFEEKIRKVNRVVESYEELCENVIGHKYRVKGFTSEVNAWTWLYKLMDIKANEKSSNLYHSNKTVFIIKKDDIVECKVNEFEVRPKKGSIVLCKDGKQYIPHKSLYLDRIEAEHFKELLAKENVQKK